MICEATVQSEGSVTFCFQGGEPTMAGLPFFHKVMELEQKYSRPDLKIYNALQTNGTLLDEERASFL